MSNLERYRGAVGRLVNHFGDGGTITIRRRHSLINPSAGGVATALAVDGLTAAGAQSIDLDAAALTGTLIVGIAFTIAGDGETYTTTNTVTASSNALAGVTFTPALALQAANDAVVTIATAWADYTLKAAMSNFAMDKIDGTVIRADDLNVMVDLASGATVPAEDDSYIVNGLVYQARALRPLQSPNGQLYAMRLILGR